MEDRFCPHDGTYGYPDGSGRFYCGFCSWISEPPDLPKIPEVLPSVLEPAPQPFTKVVSATPDTAQRTVSPPPSTHSLAIVPVVQNSTAQPIPAAVIAPERTTIAPAFSKLKIVTIVLLVAVAGYIVYRSLTTFPQKIDRALAAGQIFSPPGSCVFDLWTAEQVKNPGSSELAAVGAKIRSVLAPKGDDAFNRWYKDSDDTVNWDEMSRTYGFLLRIYPEEVQFKVRSLYATGQKELISRNFQNALAAYDAVLALDACNVLALNGLGKIYMRDGSPLQNKDRSIQFYQKATSCDSSFTWAYTNLGNYYMLLEQWGTARAYMLNALRTSPGRASILRALGRISYNQSRYSEALKYYQDSLQNERNPEAISSVNNRMEQIRLKMH